MTSLEPFQPWLDRWRLQPDGEPFATPFGSRLLAVRAAGEAAMLKIAGHLEEQNGGLLMAWWGGEGAARVLYIDGPAMVMERLSGPRSLADMARTGADEEAARILCDTAVRLHAPRAAAPPETLVPLTLWHRSLGQAAASKGGPFAAAWPVAQALLAEPRDAVVLHGDLHHGNVLDGGERGWLVIDPKGLVGERGFEYANLFRNPDADLALAPGRLARLTVVVAAAAELEPVRLLAWTYTYAVLGAAWSLEHGDDEDAAVGLQIAAIARAEMAR